MLLRFHIFRNHDPFMRCSKCWKMCKDENEAESHHADTNCVPKASPGRYWITREQRLEMKNRKFVGGHTENWFCLFDILLPNVQTDDPNGYKQLSPCKCSSSTGPSVSHIC